MESTGTQLVSSHDEELARQKAAIKKKNKRIEKNMKRYQVLKHEPTTLPMDLIITKILVRIPPDLLLQNFRYVCKEWSNIISTPDFIHKNMSYSKPKLILLFPRFTHSVVHALEMKEGELVHSYKVGRWKGFLRNCCKGLVLVDETTNANHHVFNPVTSEKVTLPICPSGCPHEECSSWLVFDSSNNVFKVVHMYADQYGFEIWSLGVDTKWRVVPGPFEDQYDRPFSVADDFHWNDSVLVNDEILHWYVSSHKYIISMDVSDELSRKTILPYIEGSYNMIEMGGYLSIMVNVSDTQIDAWILQDFQRGKWIKRHSITTSSVKCKMSIKPQLKKLVPILSLSNGDLIIFKKTHQGKDVFYTYDIKLGILKILKMNFNGYRDLDVHVDSLISWRTQDQSLRTKLS